MKRKHFLFLLALLLSAARGHSGESTTTTETAPAISFLEGDDAAAVMVDEKLTPYHSILQQAEIHAKTGGRGNGKDLEAAREGARALYRESTLPFTDEERATLRWYVGRIDPILAEHFPLVRAPGWSFIKVANHIEGGLPHTRNQSIVLTGRMIVMMAHARHSSEGRALRAFGNLLIHEQIHVVQRLHPELFRDLYVKVFKFEPVKRLAFGAWLTERQIVNPDGVDTNWILAFETPKGTVHAMPLLILSRIQQPRMPRDFEKMIYLVEQDGSTDDGETWRVKHNASGRPVGKMLGLSKLYTRKFGRGGNNYHPNEIAADMFATFFTERYLLIVYPLPHLPSTLHAPPPSTYEAATRWFRANLQNEPETP